VLDADTNLLQVRDAKAQAQTEVARAAIASFHALGGGWDARYPRGSAPTATQNHARRQH
jgi:outer membrane protein TolC